MDENPYKSPETRGSPQASKAGPHAGSSGTLLRVLFLGGVLLTIIATGSLLFAIGDLGSATAVQHFAVALAIGTGALMLFYLARRAEL